jgi:hypothetical protein
MENSNAQIGSCSLITISLLYQHQLMQKQISTYILVNSRHHESLKHNIIRTNFPGTVCGVISAALCELQVNKHTHGVLQLRECIMTLRCYLQRAIFKLRYQPASGSSI